MLGIIVQQSGKIREAIGHLRGAISIAPNVALYHANLGEMCRLFVLVRTGNATWHAFSSPPTWSVNR
jgi:hypothetical protein